MHNGGFTVIVLAGQRPGKDPMSEHFGEPRKALIGVGGRPMLAWVGAALAAQRDIERIVILAQDSDALLDHPDTRWLRDDPRVMTRDGGASIVEAISDTLKAMPDAYPFLLTTADNVLLDEAMLQRFTAEAAGADVAAALVERRTLETAYPGNRRTWLPFRGGAYSGANLFWLGSPAALDALAVWRRIEQQRKKARAVLGAFGIGLALLIAARLVTLDQAMVRAGRKIGVKARAVVLPFAEACIDVDKPSDHAMVEEILRKRSA